MYPPVQVMGPVTVSVPVIVSQPPVMSRLPIVSSPVSKKVVYGGVGSGITVLAPSGFGERLTPIDERNVA